MNTLSIVSNGSMKLNLSLSIWYTTTPLYTVYSNFINYYYELNRHEMAVQYSTVRTPTKIFCKKLRIYKVHV